MSETPRWRRVLWKAGSLVALVAVLALLMLWLSGTFVRRTEPGPPVAGPPPEPGAAGRVERRSFPLVMEQVGTIQTQVEAQISSRIIAQVLEADIREGDRVVGPMEKDTPATVLARLDDREVQTRIRQAQSELAAVAQGIEASKAKLEATKADRTAADARLKQAAADFARFERLHTQKVVSESQFDQARMQKDVAEAQVRAAAQAITAAERDIQRLEAQKEQAQAAVASAQVMLTYTVLRAPFNGRVVRKKVEVGTMVTPGQPLFQLESPCCPELHAIVSESLAPRLRVGDPLEVTVDALQRTFEGRLREIAPQADPLTRSVMVKVTLRADPDLVSGLFGRLRVPLGSYEALVVPQRAVRRVGQLTLVDVLDAEGRTHRRFVTLGHTHEQEVEIASGLAADEQVVLP